MIWCSIASLSVNTLWQLSESARLGSSHNKHGTKWLMISSLSAIHSAAIVKSSNDHGVWYKKMVRYNMTLNQGHISEVMVTVQTYPKLCPGHNLSLLSWILIIYRAIVSWPSLRDISPRSRYQFTHGIFVQTITFHGSLRLGWYFSQLLSMTQRLLLRRVFVPLGHV